MVNVMYHLEEWCAIITTSFILSVTLLLMCSGRESSRKDSILRETDKKNEFSSEKKTESTTQNANAKTNGSSENKKGKTSSIEQNGKHSPKSRFNDDLQMALMV
ncbi:hypothetical protein RB195_003840 [Necator americanus]|uniref:Uncharacterized protein n=1 Tax=Necator americanus TaxID=51031 RepID=A0ABR1DQZ7_NECAM